MKTRKIEAIMLCLCLVMSFVFIGFTVTPTQAQTIYWKWKPHYRDYAPSGLPDFDQRQDAWGFLDPMRGWIWTWCGPTAVANSLWWLDSEFETGGIPPPKVSDSFPLVESYDKWDDHDPQNVPPFIQDLAALMNTGKNGTEVHDLEKGIEGLLLRKGLTDKFYEITVKMPTIPFIIREFEKCEDVILLLGFWQDLGGGFWVRVGGHYVTVAGIGWDQFGNFWVAFSDPMQDNAEPPPRGTGGPGQVLPPPPHPFHGVGETLHNNATYVSHDGYMTGTTLSPGGSWGFPDYAFNNYTFFKNFQGQNIPVEFLKYTESYDPRLPVSVEVEYAVITSPWFEKPPYPDYAPSSVPDFDQKQDLWGYTDPSGMWHWSYCGPTAVSDSLWWLDSEYEPGNIPPPTYSDGFPLVKSYDKWDDHDPVNVLRLIPHLAFLMDTDGQRTGLPHNGTNVFDMQAGIAQYMSWTGVNPKGDANGDGVVDINDMNIVMAAWNSKPGDWNWDMRADMALSYNKVDVNDQMLVAMNFGKSGKFYEKTVKTPDFYYIEEEVEKCEDVILLLGFWQYLGPGYWVRAGGHYVTVTGVDSEDLLISFSDPYLDNAESGGYGRVIPPPPHGHTGPPETIHNNATYVSHDYYYKVDTTSPGGIWGPEGYPADVYLENFLKQNCPPEFERYQNYTPGRPIVVEVEYAVIVSCRTGIAVAGSEDKNVYAFDFLGNLLWTAATIAPVLSVAMDNNGSYIAAGSRWIANTTGALYLYDSIGTLKWSKNLPISISYDGGWAGTESKSVDVKYNSYNKCVIVAAAHDNGLDLYDQWGSLIWTYSDYSPETIVRISQDGNYLVSGVGRGIVHYFSHLKDGVPGWGPADGTPIWSTTVIKNGIAFWVAISGLGEYVAMSGWAPDGIGNFVELLDRSGSLIWLDYPLTKGDFIRVDMPCDGKSVVAVNDDASDAVGCQLNYYGVAGGLGPGWDLGDNVPDWTYGPALSNFDDFYSVAISGNGDIIATGPATSNSIYVLRRDSTLLQTIADGAMQSVDLTFNGKYGIEGDKAGKVWFFSKDSNTPLWSYATGGCIHSVAISKIYPCMFPYPNHDVDVHNVTRYRVKSVVGDGKDAPWPFTNYGGFEIWINITISNEGDFAETAEVKLWAQNSTGAYLIYTATVAMPPSILQRIDFKWAPIGFRNYIENYKIWATVDIVQEEIDVYDNTFVDCWVQVAGAGDISGDIPGVPDKKVDMVDMYEVSKRFGWNYPMSGYVANFDVNCDGKIDMEDMWEISRRFGCIYR